MKHCQIVFSQLFVARSYPSKLLETVNQSFNAIAQTINSLVQRTTPLTIAVRNCVVNAASAQVGAILFGAVALIANDPLRFLFRTAGPWTVHSPLFHQGFENNGVMPLAGSQLTLAVPVVCFYVGRTVPDSHRKPHPLPSAQVMDRTRTRMRESTGAMATSLFPVFTMGGFINEDTAVSFTIMRIAVPQQRKSSAYRLTIELPARIQPEALLAGRRDMGA
jgi:hypothetical protein